MEERRWGQVGAEAALRRAAAMGVITLAELSELSGTLEVDQGSGKQQQGQGARVVLEAPDEAGVMEM